ncbi:protein wvd2-like 1 [Phtheirospermum japonicum]|uniref:Protein wvd2-like 1 n=1 Tax=Phtheirospermum japonicum TaxID=374723 RepID=A0A830C3T2_9LAMI|nr:protein wvd2-like 1 [Phtheirospermum japonicum]
MVLYLEEVEKCSKPGSVIEKKAYFEAHFRKKGILRLSSPESPNEYQTSENHIIEKTGYDDESNHTDAVYNGTSTCEAQFELSCDVTDNADCISDHAKVGSFSEIEMKGNLDGEKSNMDTCHVSSVTICPFSDDRATEGNSDATSPISQRGSSSKEKIQSRVDITKPRSAPQVSAAQSKIYISNKSSKVSEEKNNKTVNNVLIRSKAEKKISLADAKGKQQMHKTPKNELDTKLEEKMHAKEAKMHQLQSKTQHKTEAEMKQLRKSLNFKATPLPSFYRDSDRKKATTIDSKPQKTRTSLSSRGTRVSENSRLSCTAGKHEASGPPQASTSCHSTLTSDSNPSSPSAVNSKGRPSQAVINSQQKHKGAEVKRAIDRGKTVDGKQKKRTERTIHAAFTNGSRTGHKRVVTA